MDMNKNTINNWQLATWSITTLTDKEIEIIEEIKQFTITILGLSETKIIGQGTKSLRTNTYYTSQE